MCFYLPGETEAWSRGAGETDGGAGKNTAARAWTNQRAWIHTTGKSWARAVTSPYTSLKVIRKVWLDY